MIDGGLGLDAWWDEPAYQASRETFSERGAFILAKLEAHDAAKLKDVLADVYRDAVPDPADMTKFEWEVILRFMGAHPDEIKDVQRLLLASTRPGTSAAPIWRGCCTSAAVESISPVLEEIMNLRGASFWIFLGGLVALLGGAAVAWPTGNSWY